MMAAKTFREWYAFFGGEEMAVSRDEAEVVWKAAIKSLEGVQTQSGGAPNQQLKQAIALVRAAGDKYIKPDDYLMSYGLLLTTIEQRACV